jgi:AcrR family transcriptional regulator
MTDTVKDSKRKAIIEAAEDEFVQKGYDGARILEIAERAGVGHPLLYYHFKTKKELFECVVKQKIGLLQRAVLVSWDDSNGSVTDKLCKIIGDHFEFVKENVDYLRFQFQEMERHPELFEEIKKTAQQEIARISNILQDDLNAAAATGSINSMDAQTLLEDILALNLFFHLTAPTLYKIECLKNDNDYYEKRKKENISLILNRLIPQAPNTNF